MKSFKSLNAFHMAIKNLEYRKFRSIAMIFFIILLSASLFISSLIISNIKIGMNKAVKRMGADIIVIPDGYKEELKTAIFTGEACTIYFDGNWAKKLSSVEGVKKASPQLYLATMTDSLCCVGGNQLIAYDEDTDFIVKSWLHGDTKLKKGEVIVGNDLIVGEDGKLKYFNYPLKVKNRMEKANMSYDTCVFMSFETAKELVQTKEAKGYLKFDNYDNLSSMVMVDVEDGYDIEQVKKNIEYTFPKQGIEVCTANALVSNTVNNMKQFQNYSTVLITLLFIMTFMALIVIFSLTIKERKREFGVLYTIGMMKSQLIKMIVIEASIISLIGGILGSSCSYLVSIIFKNLIASKLQIDKLQLYGQPIINKFAICIGISLLAGVIASLYSAYSVGKEEPYSLISENQV
ncbi:FtsX-like permease family protein [Clostridium sporogenes]|uniref:FtsX-like permease family protein n=1 Tax=Clostridium botulinum TaxID=1491 RepID=A0A6M0SVK0_CLOBO|nr:FtsX-like permease family protein [Clostridium sporogenes]NFA59569.1 FtsX-like permease family protein [Clostridium botulinum]NFI73417.1 FtsX-like permease family protein [Clostridium sporogenes]NFL71469.1 FtsX-like permease family protein [Clostridium sporogenes]NFM23276.1 FtsX-like permease family protein [Clostridium sporogenes]NFP61335.1 FtsX-like permease family protein [Clostridium sporogenes]